MTEVARTESLSFWRPAHFDVSMPVLVLFAALLCMLIIMPMSWLVYYSFVDRAGSFTLGNFVTLFTDPDFLNPLLSTVIIAISSSAFCCAFAAPIAWLV